MVGVGPSGPLGPNRGKSSSTAAAVPERTLLAALATADGIGPRRLAELLVAHGSAAAVVDAARTSDARRQRSVRGARGRAIEAPAAIEVGLADRILQAAGEADRLAAAVDDLGLTVVILDDPGYPPRLRAIELPPTVLFVLGSVEALAPARSVAVVGTRRPSEAGRRTAARIAGALGRAGATVVSGLALGIDGVAHRAVLDETAATVAVLGSGHARLTPRVHRRLAGTIAERGGAVVSEFAPWREAATWSFPRRNRLISGLADATVVVEAGVGSGALITAGWALEQGRDCFVVPGPVDSPASAGCLGFLRENHGLARIVADVPSLLEDLGLAKEVADGPRPDLADLGEMAARVGGLLAARAATVDELAAELDLSPAAVLAVLARLEVAGFVVQGIGRYRAAGRLATRLPVGAAPGGGPGPGMAA